MTASDSFYGTAILLTQYTFFHEKDQVSTFLYIDGNHALNVSRLSSYTDTPPTVLKTNQLHLGIVYGCETKPPTTQDINSTESDWLNAV